MSFSAGLWLVGFSRYTCLPACIAIMAAGACQWSGIAITTASTSGDSSRLRISFSPAGVFPVICRTVAWHFAIARLSTSHILVISQSFSFERPEARPLPRELTPIIPILILSLAPLTLPAESNARELKVLPKVKAAAPETARFKKLRLDTMIIKLYKLFLPCLCCLRISYMGSCILPGK